MPRLAANLSMMFNELPFLDRFAAARSAGFEGVEFLFPYDFPATTLRERLSAEGLTQVLFNMPPGNWADGERGTASIPGRQAEFHESVKKALDYAAALDCRQIHCMAGSCRPVCRRPQRRRSMPQTSPGRRNRRSPPG